jgi:cytochrome c-type biogenesis protein CcmH
MRRTLLAVLIVFCAITVPAMAGPRASLPDIEDEVMCPVCGVPLQLAESPQADRERAFIRALIARGATKQEVKDALVREYGRGVLSTPDDKGFDLAAWLVPAGGVLVALIALGFVVPRWRRASLSSGTGAAPVAPALSDSDSARLDADLARYKR